MKGKYFYQCQGQSFSNCVLGSLCLNLIAPRFKLVNKYDHALCAWSKFDYAHSELDKSENLSLFLFW